MTTNQMACFVALYTQQSFTKAAESLYMTQSAISKNISYLEKELDVTLVERKKGGKIQITKSGEAYYHSFNNILNKLNDTEFHVKYVLPNNKQTYRVGTMETWFIPDLIRMCNEGLPDELKTIEFVFEVLSPGSANRLIENGQFDFIFTIDPAFATNKYYEKKHIVDIHTSIYTAADNPAVENGELIIEKLEPYVYMISEEDLFRINNHQLNRLFSPMTPCIKEVSSGHSAFMNVASGSGSAISDSWSLNHFSKMTVSKIMEDSAVPVIFARKLQDDPFYKNVSDFLLKKIMEWIDLKEGKF